MQDIDVTRPLLENYKKDTVLMLGYTFPELSLEEVIEAVDFSINKRFKNTNVLLDNNYKKKSLNTDLFYMADFIIAQEPIITPYGVMFKKPNDAINPIDNMIQGFLKIRKAHKKEMFKYSKGSELFNRYNLLQLLAKIDANGSYGAIGNYSCSFFKDNIAPSVSSSGKAAISTAGMAFEQFLCNNVKFISLNDVIMFIDRVVKETRDRKYKDHEVLDRNIHVDECFYKVMATCGYGYYPTEQDCSIVYDIISRLSQEDINRLYYKNYLFEFIDNSRVIERVKVMMGKLKKPYLDPNECPEEIDEELNEFWALLKEYVYFGHQYISKIERFEFYPRKAACIVDTDSNILNLDPWFVYMEDKLKDTDIHVRRFKDTPNVVSSDEFGDRDNRNAVSIREKQYEYSFADDQLHEVDQSLRDVVRIVPEDGFRYSIINILAYCLSKMINDYMTDFTKGCNSYDPTRPCTLVMKNEFLFDRVLLTMVKKNYASRVKLQEGNIIPSNKSLDIKGMPMNKSTLNKSTQNAMKKILEEDILKAAKVDQMTVLKNLIKLEKQIYSSVRSGKKEFYKPAMTKAISTYDDPMRNSNIKAAIVWNELTDANTEKIDLNTRSAFEVAKVTIDKKNRDIIKDTYPEIHARLLQLMENPKYAAGIGSIGIPLDSPVPEWLFAFIDYVTIINNAIGTFPLESIGLHMATGNVNYTNILSL